MAKPDVDKLAGPDGGHESTRLARFWLDQINAITDNSQHKRWVYRGETIVKRYRDERNRTDEEGQRRYNALWSNVEILKPALYGKTPLPVVERRFKDKDPTGRAAAQILERALRNEIEINNFTEAVSQAVNDYLLPGRGTVWIRYEPEIEEGVSLPPETETDMVDAQGELPGRATAGTVQSSEITEKGRVRPRLQNNEEAEEEPGEHLGEPKLGPTDRKDTEPEIDEEEEKLRSTGDRIIRESTPVDFIEWHDFYIMPVRARTWAEVTAVGKRVYLSRDQAKRRFGNTIGKALPLEKDTRGDRTQNTMLQAADEDKCQVFEIWNRSDLKVYWVCKGYDYLCDMKEDPLELENFFPTPKPLFANATNETLIPVPDFIQYQDQAIQIDELTQRIAMLTKACKMAGVYNAAAKDIQRLFNESVENELIPVDDWAAFGTEKGGVEGNLSFMPIQVIKDCIQELMMVKEKAVEEMDRLTGINDIMRGTSDARETLGGVRLKTNNTGSRLQQRQNEVARFARDTVRIMADIMCNHFSSKSLIEVSGALYEEGLGPDDLPDLSTMKQLSQMPSPPPQGGPPGQAGQGPLQGPAGGGSLPQPAPTTPPNPQAGTNVVPFRPQGQMPQGMPPNGPQMPMGAPQPQIPPEILNKLQALQRIAKGLDLLRDEKSRGFRIDIEVDSTIFSDAAQDKQDRTEFIDRITQFLQLSTQMGAMVPPAVPLLGKLLLFGVRGYRVGRDLEMAIEDFTDQAAEFAKQAYAKAQSAPNPEMIKAQADAAKSQAQVQATQMKTQADAKASDAEIQRQQLQNQGDQAQAQADIQASKMDIVIKHLEVQMEQMRIEVEKIKAQAEVQKSHAEVQKSHADVQTAHAHTQQAHAATQQAHMQTQQTHIQGQHEIKRAEVEGQHADRQAAMDMEARKAEAARPQPAAQPAKSGAQ